MKKRLIYEAPEAEFILVWFEENILSEIQNGTMPSYNGNFGQETSWD